MNDLDCNRLSSGREIQPSSNYLPLAGAYETVSMAQVAVLQQDYKNY